MAANFVFFAISGYSMVFWSPTNILSWVKFPARRDGATFKDVRHHSYIFSQFACPNASPIYPGKGAMRAKAPTCQASNNCPPGRRAMTCAGTCPVDSRLQNINKSTLVPPVSGCRGPPNRRQPTAERFRCFFMGPLLFVFLVSMRLDFQGPAKPF